MLDDFRVQTEKGSYKKIDSKTWRSLARCSAQDELKFTLDTCTNSIKIYSTNNCESLWLDISDGSLGSYLYDKYFRIVKEEASVNLTTNTNWDKVISSITNSNCVVSTSPYTTFSYDTGICSSSTGSYKSVEDLVNEYCNAYFNNNKNEENTKMNCSKSPINFDFGPVAKNIFRMSPYGIAVTTPTGWVAYNAKSQELFNVDVFNFSVDKFLYKMPVAVKDIKAGDMIYHQNVPVFVREVKENGLISVVSYDTAAVLDIMPVKSPFGFNFVTKVVSFFDFGTSDNKATPDNPFGNIMPFLLMGDNGNIDPLMMFMMMNNQNGMSFDNPMMMYALFSNGEHSDMFPWLFMMNK